MFSIPEMIFLAVVALIVIGPKQLPEVARNIARFLNEMRRASSSMFKDLTDTRNNITMSSEEIREEIKRKIVENSLKNNEEIPKSQSGDENV